MPRIPIEISARHIHLSQEGQDKLFGKNYKMKILKELSQKGQFAYEETLLVVGSKGELTMRVLGPCRPKTQVEVSATDARTLGIEAPIRDSGGTEGTPGCELRGPSGSLELKEGVLIPTRHIHMSPEEAKKLGLRKGQHVKVFVKGEGELVFHKVNIRVHHSFHLSMHLTTDEGNAAAVKPGSEGELINNF